jgi:hypothetical protein
MLGFQELLLAIVGWHGWVTSFSAAFPDLAALTRGDASEPWAFKDSRQADEGADLRGCLPRRQCPGDGRYAFGRCAHENKALITRQATNQVGVF